MASRKEWTPFRLLGYVFGFAAFVVLAIVLVVALRTLSTIRQEVRDIKDAQRKLLYKTDHAEILRECDDLIAGLKSEAATRPGKTSAGFVGAELQFVPAGIRSLKPGLVFVTANQVTIVFGGGLHTYKLCAYAVGEEQAGTKQLIGRLWFYDESGKVPDP